MWHGMGHSGAQWRTTDGRQGATIMFLGEYQHTLDPKGRVVLPAKFREELEDGCVVTKGQERGLYVYPFNRWEAEVGGVNALPRFDVRARKIARALFANADQQKPDKQGRMQVPAKLRDYAGLEKNLTVVGVGDYLEIWDTTTWDQMSVEADDYYAGIEEALGEHGN